MAKPFAFRSRALVTALPLLCACGTDGFFETISASAPGTSDTSCDMSTRGSVSSIEVGEREVDELGETIFVPLDEGSMATVIRGTQGADMLVLLLRVSGAGTEPVCLEQRTEIEQGGERISFNYVAKRFLPEPDGTSLSNATFFPGAYTPGQVTIRVTLGGKSLVRRVEVLP
jgi:hypothetical protein